MGSPASAIVSLSQMDAHTIPPQPCAFPPRPSSGRVAGQSKAASVQVCQYHISLPVQSMPGWPSSRCLSQHLAHGTCFVLLMTETSWPGDMVWANHQDSHWWRTLASHQRKVLFMCESGALEGEGWGHRRWARAPQCGTYSESEVSACPVPTWRLMAMPLSWSRDCSLRTFFTVTPESEGERSPSFVPREVVLDETVLWL